MFARDNPFYAYIKLSYGNNQHKGLLKGGNMKNLRDENVRNR